MAQALLIDQIVFSWILFLVRIKTNFKMIDPNRRFWSMSSFPWQRRWDPFREIQREMGRLFQSLEPFHSVRHVHHYPPLNLHDAGDRYILSAQVPGITPADIDLTITGETLTLRGERNRAEGVKDDSFRRQERPMGRWARTITLPDRVDSAQVAASFSNGILTVSLPKAESAKPRHIAVTAAGGSS
jgi:HSP20 family protein